MNYLTTPRLRGWLTVALGIAVCLLGTAQAEGSVQSGLGSTDAAQPFNQFLFDYDEVNTFVKTATRPIYVDIQSTGEVINVSLCGTVDADPVRIEIYDPAGTQVVSYTPATSTAAGKIACNAMLNTPITNAYKYTTTTTGTYQVRLFNTSANENHFKRFDITVTPNTATNPDPRTNGGRVWAYAWAFNGNNTFTETGATDANYFVRVPGGRAGSEYIWKLDLNRFAGQRYEIIANSIGLNAPNSGYSTDGASAATPLHAIYLSYPAQASSPPTAAPVITGFRFEGANGRPFISPGNSTGVNDSGTFRFTPDVAGTYALTVDTNKDGVFGVGDRLLLGTTTAGVENAVAWDGRNSAGNTLAVGNYAAELKVRLGEYHFVAYDVETSGGTSNGLTVYRATSQSGTANTQVYWDDVTKLVGLIGTSNLPGGGTSGTAAGFHTWGNYAAGSLGDTRYLDTYVYGLSTTALASATLTTGDAIISGKVYDDANFNGNAEAGETGIQNATLQLLDSQQSVVTTLQTDSGGNYAFLGVNAGTYTVKVVSNSAVSGKVPTGPDPAQRSVTVTSNTAPNNDFGFGPPRADLTITKTGPATAAAGTEITYLLTLTNAGPSAANGATFSDNVPNNLTGVTAACQNPAGGASGCTLSIGSGNNVTGSVATFPGGGKVEVLIRGTIPPGATAALTNAASVKVPSGITDPASSGGISTSQTVTTALTKTADLSVTKTDGLDSVVSGQAVTYTIVVANAGPSSTTASFADTTFSGVTLSNWTCTPTSGTATCPTGLPTSGGYSNGLLNLPAGSSLTFQVTGRVTAASGTISNTATLTEPSGTTDPQPGNNSATDSTTVQASVIVKATLSKTVRNLTLNSAVGNKADGLPGHTLEYCIAYANEGNVTLPNFKISDPLPANTAGQANGYGAGQGVRVVRGAAAPTYLPFANPVVVSLGTLAVNDSGSVCFRATIN
jgi:uncharacterized repeat protein (TIGR01451 family)